VLDIEKVTIYDSVLIAFTLAIMTWYFAYRAFQSGYQLWDLPFILLASAGTTMVIALFLLLIAFFKTDVDSDKSI
jgi:hypothetical protein